MKTPTSQHVGLAMAIVGSLCLIGSLALAIRGHFSPDGRASIAAALLQANARYRFNDGVWRRGWSTIHRLDADTARRVESALQREAERTRIPVNYLAAYVRRESTGDPRAEFRNIAKWDAAEDDRGRFAATDHGLVQISGQNLLAMFPNSPLDELKARAEDVEFATRFLANQVASDLKWAKSRDIGAIDGIDEGIAARAKNPYWLAILAYNRGRAGALSALHNPRACLHAEMVVKDWAEIDAITGVGSSAALHAPVFPPLPPNDPLHFAMGDVRPNVEALQRLLNDRLTLSPPLKADGNFGPATRAALVRFQTERQLGPTGATNAETWAALLDVDAASLEGNAQPLVMGAVSPRVAALQRQLNDHLAAGPALVVDGNFGRATRDALIGFQRSKGIAPTGAADARTVEALDAVGPKKAADGR